MKTIKRTFAMLLLICMMLSMTVPAVWAEATGGVLTYTFGFDSATTRVDGTSITNDNTTGTNANPYRGDPAQCPGYPLKTKNGYFLNGSAVGEGFELKENYLTYRNGADRNHWFTIQIDGVSKGIYDMKFQYGSSSAGGVYEIYVLPCGDQNATYNAAIGAENLNTLGSATASLDATTNKTIFESISQYAINKDSVVEFVAATAGSINMDVNFPEAGSYVLFFRNVRKSTGYRIALTNLTMTPVVATVGDTSCTNASSAVTAIATANATDTVKITGNLQLSSALTTAAAITVSDGATLDLNGQTLTAASVMIADGGSVIDTAETAGQLTATLSASGSNGGYLPLKNSNGAYSFYKAAVNVSSAEAGKLKFQVKFDKNAGYDALAAESSNAKIGGAFAWTVTGGEAKTQSHDISYADGVTLAQKWGQMVTEKNYANGWIVLTFTGLEGFDALSVAPYIVSEGVTIQAAAQTLK